MNAQDTTKPHPAVADSQEEASHGHCACRHDDHGTGHDVPAGCCCDSCDGCCTDGEEQNVDESDKLVQLQAALHSAQEAELCSKADYQNLVRRTQEERSKLVKLASLGLVEELLEPLDHLRMASEHLQDKGLEMVVSQLWQVLENHGLQPMKIMNKPFDSHLMEVVEKEGNGEKVKKIVKQGYTLNGEVIRHAKVVVG